MQLRRSLGLICAGSLVLVYATGASALSLKPFEEAEIQLVSSSPLFGPSLGQATLLVPATATPLLCGNTSAGSQLTAIRPTYSPTGNFQQPFVFGASNTSPATSAVAYGPVLEYSGTSFALLGDPALVCYGLDANGVHGPTPGVMRDQFEGVNYSPTFKKSFNSSVVLTVIHRPTSPTDFYSYTIDVTIPAKPDAGCGSTVDCNFALLEGFDSSVFSTNVGGWCLANAGATSCPGNPKLGGININYSNFVDNQVSLAAGAAPATYHFVVMRYFASGVNALPQTDKPVAIAALFSPFDLDENFIGDNVAAGYTNSAPAVVQSDATWTSFANGLSALSENTNSGSLSFNITDADTPGAMGATVTLNLGGLAVPVTPTCVTGSGSGAANSQCSLSLNFANPSWWDASVGASYLGLANAFATDPGGIGASATIVASDSSGKQSAPVVVPIHVQSTVNNAPLIAFGANLPNVPDPNQGGTSFPTFSCTVSSSGPCSRSVDILGGLTAQAAPASAFDELAAQSIAIVPYTGEDANGGNVQCSMEQGSIFSAGGAPLLTQNGQGSFDINFLNASLASGSALCTVNITDTAASFPVGQSAATTTAKFRIVINPR